MQNFVLCKEVGYFDTSAELKPLLHLWSLAVGKQFYLVYPVKYFSVLDTLCNDLDGCLVRATDEQTSFTTWDYGHLTASGARIVAGQLPISPDSTSDEHRSCAGKTVMETVR